MYLVGLTGGVAAGKSTVAARWRELGAIEIDADQLAREAIAEDTPGFDQVVEEFGEAILTENGAIDRKALGALVFSDPTKKLALEAIVHPIVRQLAAERLAACSGEDIVVYNVPLLVEASVNLPFDFVATVEAPETEQVRRMVQERGLSASQAKAIISNQTLPAQRANVADVVVNSNQPLVLMIKDIDQLYRQFERELAAKQQG
jgi:dephospho-CoA kinase